MTPLSGGALSNQVKAFQEGMGSTSRFSSSGSAALQACPTTSDLPAPMTAWSQCPLFPTMSPVVPSLKNTG